jgi:hypothetical protein
MKARLMLSMILVLIPCLSMADDLTVTDNNASLKVSRDPPIYNYSPPSDPVQLPRKMEWTVDGRRIVVYPSGPWGFIDIGHFHTDSHVGTTQLHAQGPMIGYATSASDGSVTGGAVYSVYGGAPGSRTSRIVEKVDIHNKTESNMTVSLTGMGFKPQQASLEVPDYSGLEVTGTTTVFYQGNASTYSISDASSAGFPPVVVRPVVSFSGFNPLFNQSFSIPPGAVLTMITELNVKPVLFRICERFSSICDRLIEIPRP